MSKTDIELQVTNPSHKPSAIGSIGQDGTLDDDAQLRRLGKKPLLNRSFGFMSILGFACSAVISWEGILVSSVPGLLNGGPAGVIYGFLVNWIGTTSVYAVLAELASMAPTTGGQYHWVAMMAPESCKSFLAYTTAWLTITAWQAISASTGYLIATILQGMIVLARPSYVPLPWHTMLIMWAAVSFAVLMNSTTGRALARFEGLVLCLHLAGFFGVLIPMVYFAAHNEPSVVFTTFLNEGHWPTQALSFFVGFPASASSLIGADCAVHMSEEIQSAAVVVPRALMYTIFINGSLAFAMLIGMLFCLTDIAAALGAAETMYYPFIQIFYSSVKSTAGACVMVSIILVLAVACSVGTYASAARMLWSFSRDRGLPFDRYLFRLTKNSLPVVAIFTTLGFTMILSFIILGSAVVLNALFSLVIAALYSSYLIVCALLLWRRSTGAVQPYLSDSEVLDSGRLAWGPWRLPEPFGTFNNAFACLYSIILLFWSFWPPQTPATPETFNWSIVVFGGVMLFSVGWYLARARHYFKGPVKEI